MYNNSDGKSYLARVLRRLRVSAGFTQQNMADVLNINRSTYTYYETGKTTPDIQSLKMLANILNVDIDVFLEDGTPTTMMEDFQKRRPGKKVLEDPQGVGGLSRKEKELIARLRAGNRGRIDEVLGFLGQGTAKDGGAQAREAADPAVPLALKADPKGGSAGNPEGIQAEAFVGGAEDILVKLFKNEDQKEETEPKEAEK